MLSTSRMGTPNNPTIPVSSLNLMCNNLFGPVNIPSTYYFSKDNIKNPILITRKGNKKNATINYRCSEIRENRENVMHVEKRRKGRAYPGCEQGVHDFIIAIISNLHIDRQTDTQSSSSSSSSSPPSCRCRCNIPIQPLSTSQPTWQSKPSSTSTSQQDS
jgi:hypothetical protein